MADLEDLRPGQLGQLLDGARLVEEMAHQPQPVGVGQRAKQVGGRLQSVDRVDKVVLVGCKQCDATVGESDRIQQEGVEILGVVRDGRAGGAGGVQRGQNVVGRSGIGVAEPLE